MPAIDTGIKNANAHGPRGRTGRSLKQTIDELCLSGRRQAREFTRDDIGFTQFSKVLEQAREISPLLKPCVAENDEAIRKANLLATQQQFLCRRRCSEPLFDVGTGIARVEPDFPPQRGNGPPSPGISIPSFSANGASASQISVSIASIWQKKNRIPSR